MRISFASPRARVLKRAGLILGLFMAVSTLRAAAVSVSPMAVYLDQRTRTGTITLYNGGTRPEEITVGFAFGYPQSDEEGNVTVPILSEVPEGEPSAVGWLQAFPRRLVLEPGQRQVVRLMIRPPEGLDEGEYWARALVRARGGQDPIEERSGGVAVQIEVETVVVLAVNYRHGAVETGLRVTEAEASAEAGKVVATVDVERVGNAAFLGRVLAEALDARGEVVGSTEDVLAVYHHIRRRLEIPVPTGTEVSRVRFTMDTERDDLPPGGALPAQRVVHEVPLP